MATIGTSRDQAYPDERVWPSVILGAKYDEWGKFADQASLLTSQARHLRRDWDLEFYGISEYLKKGEF